jgi:ParB-like chromosome segregation protein Spo0J
MKVKVDKVKSNPKNPRLIKDDKFKKLVKSIKEFPEMETVRPIVVNKDMVILGGNMRYKAMIECGYKEVNVEVVDWSEQKQNEFIIKDNVGFGEWEWEIVANEWDVEELDNWGLDLPLFDKHLEEAELKDLSDKLKSEFKIEIICKNEEEQEKTYNKLIEENYECRLLTL